MDPNVQGLVREGSKLRVQLIELGKEMEQAKIKLSTTNPVDVARNMEDTSEQRSELKQILKFLDENLVKTKENVKAQSKVHQSSTKLKGAIKKDKPQKMPPNKKSDFLQWVNNAAHILRTQMKVFDRKKSNFEMFKQALLDAFEVEKMAVDTGKKYSHDVDVEESLDNLDYVVNESDRMIHEYNEEIKIQEVKIKKEKLSKSKLNYKTSFRKSLLSDLDEMVVLDRGVKWNRVTTGSGSDDKKGKKGKNDEKDKEKDKKKG